jgi:hypothetical protein
VKNMVRNVCSVALSTGPCALLDGAARGAGLTSCQSLKELCCLPGYCASGRGDDLSGAFINESKEAEYLALIVFAPFAEPAAKCRPRSVRQCRSVPERLSRSSGSHHVFPKAILSVCRKSSSGHDESHLGTDGSSPARQAMRISPPPTEQAAAERRRVFEQCRRPTGNPYLSEKDGR